MSEGGKNRGVKDQDEGGRERAWKVRVRES